MLAMVRQLLDVRACRVASVVIEVVDEGSAMDSMAVTVQTAPPPVDPHWDDIVDRLAVYDLHYLTGGSAWEGRLSPYRSPADAPIDTLVLDLARASQGRLQNALVALLFRHPERAPVAVAAAERLALDDRARLVLQASVLAAAALRRMWRFVLDIYLPGQPASDASELVRELDVPSPEEDYGRPCLAAVADLLRAGQPFPFAYERGWRDVAEHVLRELRIEARRRGD